MVFPGEIETDPDEGPFLKAALNGSRDPHEHSRLPVTAEELARESRRVVGAGADAIHLHVRNAGRIESLAPKDVDATLEAVRHACPDTPIGISTAAWIVPDADKRLRMVQRWREKPNFASVNFNERGAVDLMKALLDLGVGVEVGLNDRQAAETFLASGLADKCVRVVLQPRERDSALALERVSEIEHELDAEGVGAPRLLHGFGPTTWPLIDIAIVRRYETRIGLEDTLTLPDSSLARDNANLVRVARGRKRLLRGVRGPGE
ncbi:MAG: 3-keto-5-aminohexanoate cleavage protein [Gemmatimonadetes bacterium]|nr:3-keto-5-aminohexanoate cleavage protein [Gemmatimonadota bacterium]